MARMIPSYCSFEAPPGEQAIFKALRDDSETSTWIALHSLAISDHVRQVEGEADFVVIVPEKGVLILEVKSHLSVERRDDGMWKLGNGEYVSRGPFKQANEAMYSIRSFLAKKMSVGNVPIVSAVWFTGMRAKVRLPTTPEWHSWQVLDSEDLRSVSKSILRTLDAGVQHLGSKVQQFSNGKMDLDSKTAERIANLLRPKFEVAITAGDRRNHRQAELMRFVEEQFYALDAASDNRSILFSGPAGSGKTLLAMETFRRELAQGHTGRLFCFNRLLGRRLVDELSDTSSLVGTFHQEMLRLAGLSQAPPGSGEAFWRVELPELAFDALTGSGAEEQYDFVVLDEVQDLVNDAYLDILDLMVKGGLCQGRILFFGDFERQSIFEVSGGLEMLRERIPHLAHFKLVMNCRNLPRIGYQVNQLSHFQPGYEKFRRSDDGVDPLLLAYNDSDDRAKMLKNAISMLRQEGYSLNEITVLSPARTDSTAESTDDAWLRQVLTPATGIRARPGEIHYSTIHAFKGLESPAVIVADIDQNVSATMFDSLFYIGLTRATDRLVVLFEPNVLRQALGGHT